MRSELTSLPPWSFRSVLFAPGNHPRRAAKAFESGADVAILDLEDAVPVAEKEATRAQVASVLARPRTCGGYVRVNGFDTSWCYADLVALVGGALDGIVLPKTESAEQLRSVDWVVTQLERERGVAAGATDLIPLVETAKGVMALETIAMASPRVRRIAFGGGDYTLDLGMQWSASEDELAYVRARLVHCSRAGGIDAPIDTVLLQIRDAERFSASAQLARRLGFQGKLCIHPDQVPLANAAFSPSTEEVAQARQVVALFEAAERNGSASISVDGQFVDYAIAHRARRILSLASRRPD